MKRKKLVWTLIRIVSLSFVGLINTVWIETEQRGHWNHYFGFAFLLIVAIDIISLAKSFLTSSTGFDEEFQNNPLEHWKNDT